MTLPKFLAILSIVLFVGIGIIAFFKNSSFLSITTQNPIQAPLEVELDKEIQTIVPAMNILPQPSQDGVIAESQLVSMPRPLIELPEANLIEQLFNTEEPRLSIVETITYKSHVPWLKGRPAWLSDYAAYYSTSRHFIARSLNGMADYWKQDVKDGDRFNVFRKDKNIEFYLVIDISRCKMWVYYLDLDARQKVLLKTYQVGLGRVDPSKASGLLTPLGKYSLGSKFVTYKPKTMGTFQGKNTEMITVFGTRWIPFEKEIGKCTAPAKGFGIHGTPWIAKGNGQLVDNINSIGKYESDGCIRLSTTDMEELYAIIVTKKTIVEIVRDFSEAELGRLYSQWTIDHTHLKNVALLEF